MLPKRAILGSVLLAFLSAASVSAYGQNAAFMRQVEKSYIAELYQQDSLMLVDPVGDARLIRRLDTIPIKLGAILFRGKPLPQSMDAKRREEAVLQDKPLVIGRSLPIDVDRLLNKCAEIMRAHFPEIFPTAGQEHRWSPEAEDYLSHAYWHRLRRHSEGHQQNPPVPILGRSKLFLCLACGWTSKYCVTGKEAALTGYIMSRPDRSVMPHELFEESYVLNGGNIYLSFLTCENILTSDPHRKGRYKDPMQQKLAYIRHDSTESGDNYGAWYHLFGIALYSMLRPELKGLIVADAESIGSFFFEGSDRQEDMINHYGAIFGQKYRKMLEDGSWWLRGGRTDYLLPNEVKSY